MTIEKSRRKAHRKHGSRDSRKAARIVKTLTHGGRR